jgi:hypothetical protein
MPSWAITARSGWFPGWRAWGFACCSTSVTRSSAAISGSIWLASMMATMSASIISKRRPRKTPHDEFSILLSHTPEIYRQAAHAGFDLRLSGHTHGGQICLPGAIPITLDSVLPRRMGSGAWRYHGMADYTSVGAGSCIVAVRLNCPPLPSQARQAREGSSSSGRSGRQSLPFRPRSLRSSLGARPCFPLVRGCSTFRREGAATSYRELPSVGARSVRPRIPARPRGLPQAS